MKMRIGTRLMLGASAGVLAVVLIVSFVAYRIARNGLEGEIHSHLKSVAQSRAAHVWTFLDEHKEYIWLAARSTRLVEGLRSLKAGHPDPASVVRALNARLSLFPDPDADVYEVLLLDRDGVVVASMHPGSIGLDRSADAAFVGGCDGPFIMDPYLCARTSRQSFSIAAPVLEAEGGVLLGVLVARFDMAGLNAICTDQTGLGRTGETYLINKYGFMITPSRSQKDTFLKLKIETENARWALEGLGALRRGLPAQVCEHEATVLPDYRGVPALGVHAHIPEMAWSLLAEIDAAEAFAPIAQLKRTLVIFGALFSAAALVGAYFFARRVSGPIHRLHRGSERIGAGELDHRLEIKTGDEIEQLADGFNRMAGKLSESYASLEQKVAERTASLTNEIAERERAEGALRASESKYRTLLENLPQKIFLKDANSTYVSCNESYARDLNIRPAEIAGKTDYEFYPKQLAEKYRADDRRIIESGKTEDIEERYIQDGRDIIIHTVKTPIRDAEGNPVGVLGIFWDITEQKRIQDEIRQARDEWQTTFEAIGDSIFLVDPDLRIQRVNRAACGLLGGEEAELLGRHCYELVHGTQRPPENCPMMVALKSGQAASAELQEPHLDNRWVRASVFPILDEKGQARQAVHVISDITRRIEMEAEVRRCAADLRTRNEELARERERALEASRLKSQFLANMSHELRTPINAVLGYARFLQRQGDNLTAQQKSDVERIRVRTLDLLNLINSVLDLSKIEAGRMDLSLAPAAAPSLIQDALTAVTPMADHKGLMMKCLPPPPDLSPIQTDARKVVQILINLLLNAVKFTEKGSVTIGVRLVHQPGEVPEAPAQLRDQLARTHRPMIVFSVTDTGIGIPPEHLLHVFEEFRQLDGGPSRKQGGTGLGLSISKKLAGVLGGDLWAESRPGVGSTFHLAITMDLAQARADNVKLQAEVTRTERETESQDEQPVILAIEDDADTIVFLKRHLSERGFQVLSAFDGTEGLRQAREVQPDGIVLDILIPAPDGWSVLSELKSDPKTWDIPVVVYSVVEGAERGLSLGAEDYLVKPVEGERLAEVIERVVNGHRGAVLIVDDDPDALDTYGRLLRERSLNVVTAAGGRQCLKEIETQTPALILLDLMMPELDGFEVLRRLEGRPEWGRVPVVVLTAKDLTEQDRHALRGRVQDIVQKTGLDEELFADQIVSLLHRTSRKKEGSRNEKA